MTRVLAMRVPIPKFPALLLAVALPLSGGCRERDTAPPVDSALARDIAMAQQPGVAPMVFNDAPLGASSAPTRATSSPAPRKSPSVANRPSPSPSPRRNPPAPVVRSPRPSAPAPVAPRPEPSPTPGPAPAPAAGVIGAGSRVAMATNGPVCTRGLLVGDKFSATVTTPTMGTNGAIIPAGAVVVLEVAAIDRADPAENSRVEFRVRAIDVNGEARQVDGDVATLSGMQPTASSSGGSDRTKVIGGAVAGAVLGRILGKSTKSTIIGAAAGAAAGTAAAKAGHGSTSDACLPDGSALRLTLSRDVVIRRGAI